MGYYSPIAHYYHHRKYIFVITQSIFATRRGGMYVYRLYFFNFFYTCGVRLFFVTLQPSLGARASPPASKTENR